MLRQLSTSSLLLLFGLICQSQSQYLSSSASKVDSSLLRTMKTRSTAKIMIEMAGEGTSKILERVKESSRAFSTRSERVSFTIKNLKSQTDSNQKNIVDFLNKRNERSRSLGEPEVEVTAFWITNKMCVQNADLNLIEELGERDDVLHIRESIVVPLFEPMDFEIKDDPNFSELTPQWNIQGMGAYDAWTKDVNGTGVMVAIIDTGMLGTHEAIAPSFSGHFSDPVNNQPTPYDDHGHGTHVTGISCGQYGIGVAPGAKWIGCKGCALDGCYEDALLSCAQFIGCPDPDCKDTAHIVSNSWGGYDGGNQWYRDCVNVWTNFGIIPFFAAGNSGPSCNTMSYPASEPNVIAVAACDKYNRVAGFSSKGPATSCPLTYDKPDFTAYGVYINSSWADPAIPYGSLSGTSMACPGLAGLAALYLSEDPSYAYDITTLRQKFTDTATHCEYTGQTCFETTHNAEQGSFKNWWDGRGMPKYVSQPIIV